MKNIVVLLLVSVFLVSCEKPSDCFESTGDFITKEFPATAFHTIYIHKGVGMVLKQGAEYKVEVRTGENLMDNISVEFKEDSLDLKDNSSCNWVRDYGQVKVYVTTPHLNYLKIYSKTEQDIDSDGVLTYDVLHLISLDEISDGKNGSGTGDFHIQVNNSQTIIENNNVSRFYISGQTNEAVMNFYNGNGRIEAGNLIAQNIHQDRLFR
ncbi:MAG: GIN domain-containing protein, partial [Flavobacterium sp.]